MSSVPGNGLGRRFAAASFVELCIGERHVKRVLTGSEVARVKTTALIRSVDTTVVLLPVLVPEARTIGNVVVRSVGFFSYIKQRGHSALETRGVCAHYAA